MLIRAAFIEEKSAPFVLRDVALDEPRPDELRVRVVASGASTTSPGLPGSSTIPADPLRK